VVRPLRSASSPDDQARPFPQVDLAAVARAGVPQPQLLCGGLLYRGGLHSLTGPPDAGKSMLLYHWTLVLLGAGERVLLLDEESGREQVTEKLLALGATPQLLERLAYVEFPARLWDAADRRGLGQLVAELQPALIGVDSAGAFLAQAGLVENDAGDVTCFYKGVLLPIARDHQTAVVVLDHLTKDADNGRYARGSGAKLQLVDVALRRDPVTPFTRASSGVLTLHVTKDRRGYLDRAHEVQVAVEAGRIALAIHPETTSSGADGGGLTGVDADPRVQAAKLPPAARKLLEAMRAAGEPQTARQLVDRVAERYHHGLQRPTVSSNLNLLAEAGLADSEAGEDTRGTKRWWALQADDTPWTGGGEP